MVPPNNPEKSTNNPVPPKTAIPTPPPPPPRNSNSPFFAIALTIGFVLLAAVAWLTYSSMKTTRALEQKVMELQEAEQLRSELEVQYNDALAELEQLKGDNEQINALIDQQKTELERQKNEISQLLREKRRFDTARAEIKDLKTKVAGYIAEIEQLRAEQEMLAQENNMLKEERDQLSTTLRTKLTENETLSSEKAQLVSEKEELSKSVEIGSVIKVKEISVTGQKVRKSGKAVSRDNAKKVDQLKVCFTTVVNDLVQPGTEKFFIRIISPQGETLAVDDLGSGVIEHRKSGDEVRYTQVKEYDYANDETQLCFLWNPSMAFQSGSYDVEIYNKGYIAGTGTFELK